MKQVDQDPVVYESALKKEQFSYNKVLYGVLSVRLCLHYTTGDTRHLLRRPYLRSILGCPWAFAQYLRALFGQKENFNVYFSGKRRSLLHPNTAQRSFFPLQSFSMKT